MRACVQRVSRASVEVEGEVVGEIQRGLLILLAIGCNDDMSLVQLMVEKLIHLRIFDDEKGKMNLSMLDVAGGALVVSQFTLYADCSRGRRPSYTLAAAPEPAERLYGAFLAEMRKHVPHVAAGRFRAQMQVHLVNDGPVTIWLEL